MAFEVPGQMVSLDSGSTAIAQFLAVSVDATGVILPGSTTDAAFAGVAQNGNDSTTAGEAINVMIGGISKIQAAGSTLAAGDGFAVDSNGYAVAVGSGTRRGTVVDGSSGSTGRVLSVLFSI